MFDNKIVRASDTQFTNARPLPHTHTRSIRSLVVRRCIVVRQRIEMVTNTTKTGIRHRWLFAAASFRCEIRLHVECVHTGSGRCRLHVRRSVCSARTAYVFACVYVHWLAYPRMSVCVCDESHRVSVAKRIYRTTHVRISLDEWEVAIGGPTAQQNKPYIRFSGAEGDTT